MGGSAFKQAAALGQPTLNTPRMSPNEYAHLKDIYLTKILAYLDGMDAKVAVLKEAPEKTSYGDMDLFIGLDKPVDFTGLANAVGATGLICHSTYKCTIGVPKDGSPSTRPTVEYYNVHSNRGDRSPSPVQVTPEEYAQVDINIVSTDLVDWHTFYSACGDLNGLLGHILTHLGFTVTDRGLWLRMKELDAAKSIERSTVADSDGKIFLSRDPNQVMRFLGLSVERWNAGFTTLNDFYSWLGACRMLHPVAIKLRRDKAHERHREEKREVYRTFFFEWLPKQMPEFNEVVEEEWQKAKIQELREQYLDEALDFFEKRDIYQEKHRTVVLNINNTIASNLLRPLIAKHSGAQAKKLPELVRAFRRFVVFDEPTGRPLARPKAHADSDSQLHHFLNDENLALRDEQAADEFVKSHWEELKGLERLRGKGAVAE